MGLRGNKKHKWQDIFGPESLSSAIPWAGCYTGEIGITGSGADINGYNATGDSDSTKADGTVHQAEVVV